MDKKGNRFSGAQPQPSSTRTERNQLKTILVVEVKGKATEPVILKNLEKGGKEEFFIRRNASAKDLTLYEFFTYAKEQWK